MDTRQVIARLEAERQALALMDHPNIAKVLDAGTTDSGRPFFVMELVKGVPITQYCDKCRLTPQERLALFVPVCQAVQHAHQKGIIHRDLKPSNLMIALYDGRSVPKVIDFGVAKATMQKLTEKTLFTGIGAVVGTLEYMSPEQAELNQLDVDTRSDIYALGVVLYELLTGSTPLPSKQLRAAAVLESLRIIREEEPPKPSVRLSTTDELAAIAAKRGLEPKKLNGLVRGDLDWIVMKCLEKDRSRRYETANGLAMDVQRYLADEPVLACPPSAAYRVRKFVRRHKGRLGAMTAMALVLLLLAGGTSWTLWERSARVVETKQTVSVVLAKAEELCNRAAGMPTATSQNAEAALATWRQAQDTFAQANTALTTGIADDELRQQVEGVRLQVEQGLRQAKARLDRASRRERLFRELDQARLARSMSIGGHLDYAASARLYATAFATYGLDVASGRRSELAQRIAAEEPAVRDALLVAIDDWAVFAMAQRTPSAKDLRALARAADNDPWRQRFRAATAANDLAALQGLATEARQRSLPTTSLCLLAVNLDRRGARIKPGSSCAGHVPGTPKTSGCRLSWASS